jgi:hypothetical protein
MVVFTSAKPNSLAFRLSRDLYHPSCGDGGELDISVEQLDLRVEQLDCLVHVLFVYCAIKHLQVADSVV